MADQGPDDFSLRDLFLWLVAGGILSVVVFILFTEAYELTGNVTISALSAFGAAMSSVISAILVGIYIKQTNILESHGEILRDQAELMELQYTPDVVTIDEPSFEDDEVSVTLENVGPGDASELHLITRLEFQGSSEYESPLIGSSIFEADQSGGGKHLASGLRGKFRAPSKLEVTSLGSEDRVRSFHNMISNLEAEIDDFRVSLFVVADGGGGNSEKRAILTEEAFYVSVSELDGSTLEECYRVSTPA